MESVNIVGLCNHRIHRLNWSFRHFELNWIEYSSQCLEKSFVIVFS
jgi:hypothetical protein